MSMGEMTQAQADEVGPYYAEGYQVWKSSIVTHNEDGSRSYTLAFVVCDINENLSPGADKAIVNMMNAGHVVLAKTSKVAGADQ